MPKSTRPRRPSYRNEPHSVSTSNRRSSSPLLLGRSCLTRDRTPQFVPVISALLNSWVGMRDPTSRNRPSAAHLSPEHKIASCGPAGLTHWILMTYTGMSRIPQQPAGGPETQSTPKKHSTREMFVVLAIYQLSGDKKGQTLARLAGACP